MFSEIYHGNSCRATKIVVWDCLTEQSDAVFAAVEGGRVPLERRDHYKFPKHGDEHKHYSLDGKGEWFGKDGLDNVAGVRQADREPWQDGIKTVERMLAKLENHKLPQPKSLKRRPVWSEDPDGEFDFDRFRSFQPAWRTCARRDLTGPRVITVAISVGADAHREAASLLWRGAAALAMCDILERSGYRAEILCYDYETNLYTNGHNGFNAVWVKRAEDSLDISGLVNGVAPWRYRTVSFGGFWLWKSEGFHPYTGYGNYGTISEETLRRAVGTGSDRVINMQDVWTEDAAVQLASNYLEEIAASRLEASQS